MLVKFSTENTSQIKGQWKHFVFLAFEPYLSAHNTVWFISAKNTFRVYHRLLTNQLCCLGTDVVVFAKFRRDRISVQWAIATNFQRSWHTIEISKGRHATRTDFRAECSNIESVSTTFMLGLTFLIKILFSPGILGITLYISIDLFVDAQSAGIIFNWLIVPGIKTSSTLFAFVG